MLFRSLMGDNFRETYSHICRTICRRVERQMVDCPDYCVGSSKYINRLSDYFFSVARFLTFNENDEVKIYKPCSEFLLGRLL